MSSAARSPCAALKGVGVVDWSADGKWIVGGNYQNDVRVWDASNGKEVAKVKGVSGQISGAAFSPDSKRFFTLDFHGLDINHGLLAWNIADVVRPETKIAPPMPKKDPKEAAMGPSASEKIEAIRKRLKDPDAKNRRLGLSEAGKLGGAMAELVPDFVTLFNDPDQQIRNMARGWLLNLGRASKAAVPAFLELYRNGTPQERKYAEAALRNIDPSALKK